MEAESRKIVCSNCGAENQYGGICVFCGSPLVEGQSDIILSDPSFDKSDQEGLKFLNDKDTFFFEKHDKVERKIISSTRFRKFSVGRICIIIERSSNNRKLNLCVKGIPKTPMTIQNISIDGFPLNEVKDLVLYQEIKSYEGKTFSKDGENVFYSSPPKELQLRIDNKSYITKAMTTAEENYSDKYCDQNQLMGRSITLFLGQKHWIANFKIDSNILKGICEASIIFIRMTFENSEYIEDSVTLSEDAQLLYNRAFDNTEYVETLASVRREKERLKEEEIKHLNQIQRKNEIKQNEDQRKAAEQEKVSKKFQIKRHQAKIGLIVSSVVYILLNAMLFIRIPETNMGLYLYGAFWFVSLFIGIYCMIIIDQNKLK